MTNSKTVEIKAYQTQVDDATLLMIEEDDCFDFYLKKARYPYEYMFGLPVDQQTMSEALEIAIANVPEYMDMFEEDEI